MTIRVMGFVDYTPHETALITSNPIAPPSGVSGQAGPTTMQLSWTANSESDIAGYKVYYDTDGSGYPYANSVSTGSTGTTYDTDRSNDRWELLRSRSCR